MIKLPITKVDKLLALDESILSVMCNIISGNQIIVDNKIYHDC